ncbi:growth hormone secretagogue receptor type 1 [Biomphalaria glabrata]|nr:growth hormone secretagogue receptor type 1 [Biomphalaria glabrata]
MQWVRVPAEDADPNATSAAQFYYTATLTDFSYEAESILDLVAGMILFLSSQTILTVCSLWMTYSLKASSKVRTYCKVPKTYLEAPTLKGSHLTMQERRLIKLVLSLAGLQIFCNLPRLAVTILYNVMDGVSAKDEKYLNLIIWTSASFFNQIYCTANTVCYYFLNSKHRHMFQQIFSSIEKRENV